MSRTGMVRSQLYYLESGQRLPRIDTLEIICQALDIPLSKFFLIVEQIREMELNGGGSGAP